MSKRKRDSPDARSGAPDNKDLRAQRKYVEGVLERSTLLLTRALKLARGFERQKLGRRQKVAKEGKNEGEGKRLVDEVAALKALDLSTTAEVHLYKTLLKAPTIAFAPALPVFVKVRLEEKARPLHTAEANVQARLFNAGPVKGVMDECVGYVRKEEAVNGVGHAADRGGELEDEAGRDLLLVASDQGSGGDSYSDYGKYEARLAGSSSNESSDDGELDSDNYDKL
ncbi:MAG: hypothetical protein Q9174_007124, partial [Haloplaca sp. 1 TL-2023]